MRSVSLKREAPETEAADAARADAPPDAPKRPRYSESVKGDDVKLAEQVRNVFEVFVDDETPPETVDAGAYWTPTADKLTTRDVIYVQPRNGRWLRELRVVYADRKTRTVQLACLSMHMLPETKPRVEFGLPPGWKVDWINSDRKHGAYREGALLRDGFEDIQAAAEYANQHASNR